MSLLAHHQALLAGGSNPWDELVASLSPRLWLKLDEASGTTANDASGNNNHGAYQGAAGTAYNLNQPPIYPAMGACARFESGYVRVPNNANLQFATQDFIAGVAFKRDAATGMSQYPKLLWKTTNYSNGHANYLIQYHRSTNKVSARVSFAGTPYFDTPSSLTTFANATPYLVFMRRLGDKLSLWVNGVKEAEATLPSPSTVLTTTADPVDIMGGPSSGTDYFLSFGDEAIIAQGSVNDATMEALWAARQ